MTSEQKKINFNLHLFCTCFLLIAVKVDAQKITTTDSISNKSLKEVLISGSKGADQRKNIVQQITTINKAEIEKTNAPTTAELLQNTGAAYVQKSQLGGGSPTIRGFEANRVGIVIDGVRMNNAIYRGGHLQNIITIDPSMLQKVEVLYGPASALYGSDALGGVIVFQSKNPVLATKTKSVIKVNALARTQSAYFEKTLHANVNIGFKKTGFLVGLTATDFDDLKTGKKFNARYGAWGKNTFYVSQTNSGDTAIANLKSFQLKRSGYQQLDAFAKALWQKNKNTMHKLNVQYSTSSNINRYDRLSELSPSNKPNFATWYYGPQKRFLTAYTFSNNTNRKHIQNINANINYQQIEESRITRRYKSNNEANRIENLNILGWDFNASKIFNDQHKITAGIDGQFNAVASKAFTKNILTNAQSILDTRYPQGGSTILNTNMYAQYIGMSVSDHWHYNAGIRLAAINTNADFGDTSILQLPFATAKQKSQAITGNVGINYLTSNNWKFSVMLNTGFRAPNIDDLAKVFESAGGNQLIVPNTTLKPEYAKNIDVSILKQLSKKYTIECNAYYTQLSNAMIIDAFTFNGADSIIYDGTLTAVKAVQNKASATLQGVSIAVQYNFHKQLQLNATVNKTIGTYVSSLGTVPMDHIPPTFGRIGLQYSRKKINAEVYSLWNDLKALADYNPYGEDNQQYASQVGAPAWYTLNAKSNVNLSNSFILQLGVENIMDIHYRTFASGISAPGRNFIIAVRANF
jgi:hemoglobin/transferrin/lactoferrin receptor protein